MRELKGNKIQRVRTNEPNKYKGISWKKVSQRWEASIQHNGKWIYIGGFLRITDAINAYDNRSIELFGDKAITNKQLIEAGFKNKPVDNFVISEIADLPNEVWVDIKDYEGIYKISNLGRIKLLSEVVWRKNKHGESLVYPSKTRDGYLFVNLTGKNGRETLRLHRLIGQHFIPNPNNLPEINHKDLDKTNNRLENLEWVTHLDNMKHAKYFGALRKPTGMNSKLKIEEVKEIRKLFHEENYKMEQLANIYNVKAGTIWFIVKNRTWKNI